MTSSPHFLSRTLRCYRLLLRLYPTSFRNSYSQEMQQLVRDYYHQQIQAGDSDLVLWRFMLLDLLKSVPREHIAAIKHSFRFGKEHNMVAPLQITFAQQTDIGLVREFNEDKMLAVLPENSETWQEKGALFIVTDGMGGHEHGDVASELAIDTIRASYYQDSTTDILASVSNAVKAANSTIYQEQQRQVANQQQMTKNGMGATCVVAVLKDRTLYLANVGDSLAYLIDDQSIRQLAENHSWVDEQIRKGVMTEEEALKIQGRNVITRALGSGSDVEPYLVSVPVHTGETLVLCTDGLHGLVSEPEIRALATQNTPEESVQKLISLANERGGTDNITVVVARIE
jgi:serine/threonine protein phosphatase PrpC